MTRKLSRRERLARLRDLMQSAADLSEPVNYFLAKLASDQKFIRQSKPGDPGLGEILETVAERFCEPGTPVSLAVFYRYAKLWHGLCLFGSQGATVLYHAGIDVGIVALPMGERTKLVRFSVLATSPAPGVDGADTEGDN